MSPGNVEEQRLPLAYARMKDVELEVPFATLYAEALAKLPLTGDAARAFGCATYGIRPEHLSLSGTDGLWRGTVRHVERLGADAMVHLATDAVGLLTARAAGDTALHPGATVFATPMPGRDHRFP